MMNDELKANFFRSFSFRTLHSAFITAFQGPPSRVSTKQTVPGSFAASASR